MATVSEQQYAGEIHLEYLRIFSSEGVRNDLSGIVVEITLFEDIFNTAFTGNIILVDTLNIIENLPILGQEYIELKCSTPQTSPTKESVIEKRFVLHSIVARDTISCGAQTYSLDIATEDSLMNLNTRVSKSYTDSIDNIVTDVLKNQLGSTQAILDTDVEELDKREEVVEIMSTRQKAINRLKRKNLDLTEANIKKEEDKVKNEEKAFELVSKGVEPYGRVSGTGVKLLNKPLGVSGATPGESPQPYFPDYEVQPVRTPTISQDEIKKFVRHPDLLGY